MLASVAVPATDGVVQRVYAREDGSIWMERAWPDADGQEHALKTQVFEPGEVVELDDLLAKLQISKGLVDEIAAASRGR